MYKAGIIIATLTESLLLVAALCVGFIVINSECRIEYFEMIGTWASGIGVATIGGIYTLYRRQVDQEFRAQQLKQQEIQKMTQAMESARYCALRFKASDYANNGFHKIQITFTNNVNVSIKSPSIKIVNNGQVLNEDLQVAPGRSWGTTVSNTIFGVSLNVKEEIEANTIINKDVKPMVEFEYSIGEYRFRRISNTVELISKS